MSRLLLLVLLPCKGKRTEGEGGRVLYLFLWLWHALLTNTKQARDELHTKETIPACCLVPALRSVQARLLESARANKGKGAHAKSLGRVTLSLLSARHYLGVAMNRCDLCEPIQADWSGSLHSSPPCTAITPGSKHVSEQTLHHNSCLRAQTPHNLPASRSHHHTRTRFETLFLNRLNSFQARWTCK